MYGKVVALVFKIIRILERPIISRIISKKSQELVTNVCCEFFSV